MKMVIQRVTSASVEIDKFEVRSIGHGYVILLGIHKDDNESMIAPWVEKILKLRLFADDQKPINRSIVDINGEILLVSQFTLYADCKGQNRPSFMDAAPPELAKKLYLQFVDTLKTQWPRTKTGTFGADMQVSLTNDGPVTIVLE